MFICPVMRLLCPSRIVLVGLYEVPEKPANAIESADAYST